jgi:hypothetical protein
MSGPNGAPRIYKVIISKQLADRIDKLHDEAHSAGIGPQFIDALEKIHDGLRAHPRAFGDPLFRLPALKLLVYVRAIHPLVVDYGVHDEQQLVFVKGIRLIAAA